jgi:hydroxymethylpyrimidine pyrophosphatase-like HAD family hydrolase
MTLDTLLISATSSAVDIALFTKKDAVLGFVDESRIPLSKIGAVGDGANDMEFMSIEGLGYIGCPENADQKVKDLVRQRSGLVSEHSLYDGFAQFVTEAGRRGIQLIYADKDGTIVDKGKYEPIAERFANLLSHSGQNKNPQIHIITGAGRDQNHDLIEALQPFKDLLLDNPLLAKEPYIVGAENGAIWHSIIDEQDYKFAAHLQDSRLLTYLTGSFTKQLKHDIENGIAPAFELGVTNEYKDQDGKIYIGSKDTMASVNVPRTNTRAGVDNFRKTPLANELKKAIISLASAILERDDIPYRIK